MADPTPAEAGLVVVALPAEIDMANADQVCQQLCSALAPGVTVLVADMTTTKFCDSMGLHALVLAYKRATAGNAQLRVVVPCEAILHVMAITELDRVLRIYPALEQAVAGHDGRGRQMPGPATR